MCFANGIISRPAVPSFLLWHENPVPGPVDPILVPASPNRGTEVRALASSPGLSALVSSRCSQWFTGKSLLIA